MPFICNFIRCLLSTLAQFKSLTQAKTPPTSSDLSTPLQTRTSAGFMGPFGDGALQRAALPIMERVSIADCCDARREGPL